MSSKPSKSNTKSQSPYALFITFILSSSLLYAIYNSTEKIPQYMDESFHLDQTFSYYNNNYRYWNSKLTTFPGTFICTSFFLKLLNVFKISINFKNVLNYSRLLVIIVNSCSFMLLSLYKNKNVINNNNNAKLKLSIIFFPINYFFNFLFYTESFSIFSLLLHFYFGLYYPNFFFVLLSGFLAVFMRQNNIIWINLLPLSECICLLKDILNRKINIKNFFKSAFDIVIKNFNIVIIDCAFIFFMIKNDFSLVLGDKSHHEMKIHLAQIIHFLIFVLIFFPSLNLYFIKSFINTFKNKNKLKNFIITFIMISLFLFISDKFSFVHDFILSDNRHYIFYYFKRIYLNNIKKNLLLLYLSSVYSLLINEFWEFFKSDKILGWMICCLICLIPCKLIEVRYFLPGVVVLLVLIHYEEMKGFELRKEMFSWINIFGQLVINVLVIYVFLFRPFRNKYFGGEISRFMY